MKEELLKIAQESLSSEEVEKIVKEKFMNALGSAIEAAFRWGDAKKAIEEKVNEVMVPYIENYDFSEYLPKLDSVLTEIVNSDACIADKKILENFKGLVTEPEQKEIKLTDLFKAWIDFSQGCDIRIMTKEKAEHLKQMKIKQVHFAWDNYEDRDMIIPKFKEFKQITGWDKRKLPVYVLVNFNTTLEQDLERIYTLRDLGYWPYVMIYNKEKLPKGHIARRLQRWVNMRAIFEKVKKFEDYI